MGWYVELKIASRIWSWRKQIPPELCLLFLHNSRVIQPPDEYPKDEELPFAGYISTAGNVLQNLDQLGITKVEGSSLPLAFLLLKGRSRNLGIALDAKHFSKGGSQSKPSRSWAVKDHSQFFDRMQGITGIGRFNAARPYHSSGRIHRA